MIIKIKGLWNGLLVFSIVTSLLILFAQILFVSLIINVNMSLAFTLIFIFFVIDAIVVVTFNKKRIENDILNISFIVLILSSPLVYGIIYYLKIFYLPINPQVVHIGSIDAWIGFAGSILSGLLVMISLVYTIKYERLIRDEDKKNELIPFIEIEVECYSEESQKKTELFDIENPWYLKITNIGNNAARNIKIIELKAWFYEIGNESNAVSYNILFNSESSLFTSLIVSEKFHEIDIQLKSNNLPKHYFNGLRLYFSVEYYDLTLKNIHKQSATFNLITNQSKEEICEIGYKSWIYLEKANNFIE